MRKPSFLQLLASEAPSVRTAAYSCISTICKRCPLGLSDGCCALHCNASSAGRQDGTLLPKLLPEIVYFALPQNIEHALVLHVHMYVSDSLPHTPVGAFLPSTPDLAPRKLGPSFGLLQKPLSSCSSPHAWHES